jgi:hypothetical protein
MPSYGVFDCPYCLDHFQVVGWPIPNLHKDTRVYVKCPGPCGKEVSLYAFEINGVLNGEATGVRTASYRFGEVEMLPADYKRTLTLTHAVQTRKVAMQYGLKDWQQRIPKEILERSIYALSD